MANTIINISIFWNNSLTQLLHYEVLIYSLVITNLNFHLYFYDRINFDL